MIKIGLLSDTHGYLHPKVFEHFKDCDEIWHAGDFGSLDVLEALENFKPLVAVYGNIDGGEIRRAVPLDQRFEREGMDIWITHIGGYPKRYDARVREGLAKKAPDVFVCGHSHILKVLRDKEFNNMMILNPGAAGKYGIQPVSTIVRFRLDNKSFKDFDVIELED